MGQEASGKITLILYKLLVNKVDTNTKKEEIKQTGMLKVHMLP